VKQRDEFRNAVKRDNERGKNGERHKAGFLGLLFYGGILGLLLVVPMVTGAFLGRWLDSLHEAYETRWTVSLIILGIATGIWNVIWYIRRRL